jgi:hypothetical protein
MTDPMAGNGKMTWQRWDWRKGERLDQIRDGQHGAGLDGDRGVASGRDGIS